MANKVETTYKYGSDNISISIAKGDFSDYWSPKYTYKITDNQNNTIEITDLQVDWLINRLKELKEMED